MKNKSFKIATCCLAGSLFTALPAYNVMAAPVAGISEYTGAVIESGHDASLPSVGISSTAAGYLEQSLASKIKEEDQTAAGKEAGEEKEADTEKDKTEKNKTEKDKKEKSKYDNMAVAQVNDYVNIRKKPDEDAELLGKLYSNSVATVIGGKDGWYKIKSGSVTGYVKGDYVTVGDEELVKSVGVQIATVNTVTLKVRNKASKKSEVTTLVPEGEELTVASMKSYKDGWVKVEVGDGQGYVSADYVDITREYTYAESRAEEEARLAIEQAKLAAEQAAANASASENSSSGTGTSGSSQSSNEAPASQSHSSSGQAVVNYASQFLGNPYVYGGSSLTNGTDCSGFVMSVYAHFGVSLPHSSAALRGAGYGVSYSSIQPGDIVCYDGHVAIYAGGNTIIHASNPATGIKYTSPANYRPIVAVRRIY